jgi:hypothetical protein
VHARTSSCESAASFTEHDENLIGNVLAGTAGRTHAARRGVHESQHSLEFSIPVAERHHIEGVRIDLESAALIRRVRTADSSSRHDRKQQRAEDEGCKYRFASVVHGGPPDDAARTVKVAEVGPLPSVRQVS